MEVNPLLLKIAGQSKRQESMVVEKREVLVKVCKMSDESNLDDVVVQDEPNLDDVVVQNEPNLDDVWVQNEQHSDEVHNEKDLDVGQI